MNIKLKRIYPVEDCFGQYDDQKWRNIPMFPAYQLSNKGYIRSLKSQRKYKFGCVVQPKVGSNTIYRLTDMNNKVRSISIEEIKRLVLESTDKEVYSTYEIPYIFKCRNNKAFIDSRDIGVGKVVKEPIIQNKGIIPQFTLLKEKNVIIPFKFI